MYIRKVFDETDLDQLHDLWRAALDDFGRVDTWINNAGVGSDQSAIRDTPPALLQRVLDTNIKGVVYGSQVALSSGVGVDRRSTAPTMVSDPKSPRGRAAPR